MSSPRVAVVDFGMGNLFSVSRSCEEAGLLPTITHARDEILAADAVLLPGVGAFGDAMDALHRLDLVAVLRDIAASETPLVGICLGMQLLMSQSEEFGTNRGLGVIEGTVEWLRDPHPGDRKLKVPEIGWNTLLAPDRAFSWEGTPLEGMQDGTFMYFVHSLAVVPQDPSVALSLTQYGPVRFCSTLRRGNIVACQYHPERSGEAGRRWYQNLAKIISRASNRESLIDAPEIASMRSEG